MIFFFIWGLGHQVEDGVSAEDIFYVCLANMLILILEFTRFIMNALSNKSIVKKCWLHTFSL